MGSQIYYFHLCLVCWTLLMIIHRQLNSLNFQDRRKRFSTLTITPTLTPISLKSPYPNPNLTLIPKLCIKLHAFIKLESYSDFRGHIFDELSGLLRGHRKSETTKMCLGGWGVFRISKKSHFRCQVVFCIHIGLRDEA